MGSLRSQLKITLDTKHQHFALLLLHSAFVLETYTPVRICVYLFYCVSSILETQITIDQHCDHTMAAAAGQPPSPKKVLLLSNITHFMSNHFDMTWNSYKNMTFTSDTAHPCHVSFAHISCRITLLYHFIFTSYLSCAYHAHHAHNTTHHTHITSNHFYIISHSHHTI